MSIITLVIEILFFRVIAGATTKNDEACGDLIILKKSVKILYNWGCPYCIIMDNSNDENYWSCDSSSSNQHGRYSNHQQQQYNNPLSSSSSSSYVTATECGHCPACCRSPSSTSSNITTDADDNNYDQDENQSSSGQCCYLATPTDITADNDDQVIV